LAKVLFQNVSPPRSLLRLSGIFFPLSTSSGALLFCFGNPSVFNPSHNFCGSMGLLRFLNQLIARSHFKVAIASRMTSSISPRSFASILSNGTRTETRRVFDPKTQTWEEKQLRYPIGGPDTTSVCRLPNPCRYTYAFNATFDQEENRWKAVQFGNIKSDGPWYEAVFHARLAEKLETEVARDSAY
jgi:hypothetical protein